MDEVPHYDIRHNQSHTGTKSNVYFSYDIEICSVDGKYLSHGSQETLRVEEPGHPEHVWSTVKAPAPELRVSL